MDRMTTIGIDLAKSVFQLHGVDAEGRPALRRQLRRSRMLGFFQRQPACLIGMEACAGAHYRARELITSGHDVRLMQPSYGKGYVKRGKTDAADAEAICEAVSRPSMRFVPVKSEQTQAVLMTHKGREFPVRQQTQIVNASCWKHAFDVMLEARLRRRAGSTPSTSCWKHAFDVVLEARLRRRAGSTPAA